MTNRRNPEGLAIIRATSGRNDRDIVQACALLNSVLFTVEQFERGIAVYNGSAASSDNGARDVAFAALVAFCDAEDIWPADIAAFSMLRRDQQIAETTYAISDEGERDVDLKREDPELYADCVTRPFHQGYFRFLQPSEIGPDGEVIPLAAPVD